MAVALIVLGILIILFFFLIFPSPRRHRDRELLAGLYIAHRGLHDKAANIPENSLPAFQAAIDHGYAIEIDIHVTADGKVVVFHDDDLERMCGVAGRIEDKTLAELRQLRLGNTACSIPTLQECLALVDGRVPLMIEFKCLTVAHCNRLCEAADAILQAYHGVYFVQSFFPFVLQWYRRHRRAICRGQLATAFYHESLPKRLLGCLLFNVIARPDFVSYDHTHAGHICRRLCVLLGAFSVGWTFRNEDELERHKQRFSTYIFEEFIPKR